MNTSSLDNTDNTQVTSNGWHSRRKFPWERMRKDNTSSEVHLSHNHFNLWRGVAIVLSLWATNAPKKNTLTKFATFWKFQLVKNRYYILFDTSELIHSPSLAHYPQLYVLINALLNSRCTLPPPTHPPGRQLQGIDWCITQLATYRWWT